MKIWSIAILTLPNPPKHYKQSLPVSTPKPPTTHRFLSIIRAFVFMLGESSAGRSHSIRAGSFQHRYCIRPTSAVSTTGHSLTRCMNLYSTSGWTPSWSFTFFFNSSVSISAISPLHDEGQQVLRSSINALPPRCFTTSCLHGLSVWHRTWVYPLI